MKKGSCRNHERTFLIEIKTSDKTSCILHEVLSDEANSAVAPVAYSVLGVILPKMLSGVVLEDRNAGW